MNKIIKKCIVLLLIAMMISLLGCSEINQNKVDFNKGSFDNLDYTNEWLDVKITFPEGSSVLSEEEIKKIVQQSNQYLDEEKNDNSDNEDILTYGFIVVDENQFPNYQLSFENLSKELNGTKYTEKKYLEESMNKLFSNEQLGYKLLNEGTVKIAGKDYYYYEMSAYNDMLYQNMYTYKLDDRMVIMTITYTAGQEMAVKMFIDGIKTIEK